MVYCSSSSKVNLPKSSLRRLQTLDTERHLEYLLLVPASIMQSNSYLVDYNVTITTKRAHASSDALHPNPMRCKDEGYCASQALFLRLTRQAICPTASYTNLAAIPICWGGPEVLLRLLVTVADMSCCW